MKTSKALFHYGLIVTMVGTGLSLFSTAYADGSRSALGQIIRKGAVARSTSPRLRIPSALGRSHARNRTPNLFQGLSRSGRTNGFTDRGSRSNGMNGFNPESLMELFGGGTGPFGSPYGGPFGGPFGDPYGYRHEDSDAKEIADAYRDVGIANAVVGLVDVLANSQTSYREPVYRDPQPTRHYVREKVILKEGYYEDYKVWIPEQYESGSRDKILGHYEMRQRWVPEVYGYRDVQVDE